MPRVLYIVYWGACEPLGQSLVLPAITELAKRGVSPTLVTFEKPADLANADKIAQIRLRLATLNVQWIALRYHKRPKVPATAFDILQGWLRGLLARLQGSYDVIHARTYIGGLIGMTLAPFLGAKWIYHNEGFYPDEQVDGGVWRAGSFPHRVAKSLEQRMYASADSVIALSHRARKVIENLPAVQRRGTRTIVVPSCVDLEQFCWETKPAARGDELRLAYIGSIGHRYIFDRIARFVGAACRELGRVRLRVLTRTAPAAVNAALRAADVPEGAWSVNSVAHAAVPAELARQDAGLFFLTQGLSEHGCSPTKIGEYWASGLPVVTTPNVSDTDDIIQRHGVGVIVRDHCESEYRRAARGLRSLLEAPDLPRRCRLVAERYYNLDEACERQVTLYRSLLSGHRLTGGAVS